MSADNSSSKGFDACVCLTPAENLPTFSTIAAAIAAAPDDETAFRILVSEGEWIERVEIRRPNTHLVGTGPQKSRIAFNRHAGILGTNGEPIGTFETATLRVLAPDCSLSGLTIENSYDYVANDHLSGDVGKVGHHGSQALALAIEGDADRTLVERVNLISHQDTLYLLSGRSLFRTCKISGSVDFIFGGGRAYFDTCRIVSRHRPGHELQGFIAAPNTHIDQPFGFVFDRCRLEREAGVEQNTVALGRPWRQTTTFPDGRYGHPKQFGAAAYLSCWMDEHILKDAWEPMAFNAKGGGRSELQPESVRFFEFDSRGPGAGLSSLRRRMLSREQANLYSRDIVLDGWAG